jgi:HEAT repeat protein
MITMRPSSLRAALLALGVAALPACKGGPFAPDRGASDRGPSDRGAASSKGAAGTGSEANAAPRGAVASARDERLFRVESLLREWDAAQGAGRDDAAATLAGKLAAEVDADFAWFAVASKGREGLRTQNLVVQALAFSRDPSATALLADRLGDLDGSIVGNALIGLKVRSDPATPIPPLVTLVRANFPEARRYAPLALANVAKAREAAGRPVEARLSDEAMTGLVGLVQDSDPYARLHAAKAMGALRRADATDFLVLLLQDVHATIRIAAAAALERIGDPRAVPPVIALLDRSPADQKTLVREVLFSYAERVQGRPLTGAEKTALDVSPRAWDRWFAARDTSSVDPRRAVAPGSRLPIGTSTRRVADPEGAPAAGPAPTGR